MSMAFTAFHGPTNMRFDVPIFWICKGAEYGLENTGHCAFYFPKNSPGRSRKTRTVQKVPSDASQHLEDLNIVKRTLKALKTITEEKLEGQLNPQQ